MANRTFTSKELLWIEIVGFLGKYLHLWDKNFHKLAEYYTHDFNFKNPSMLKYGLVAVKHLFQNIPFTKEDPRTNELETLIKVLEKELQE